MIPRNVSLTVALAIAVAGLADCQQSQAPSSAAEQMKQGAKQFGRGADAAAKQLAHAAKKSAGDAAITTKVRAALANDAGLKTLKLDVSTDHGVVTMSGTVDSEADRDHAASIASKVSGVTSVNNELRVQAPASGGSSS